MTDNDTLLQALEASDRRRADRRRFMQLAGTTTLALGLAACGSGDDSTSTPTPTPTPSPTATSTVALDVDYLNFVLTLKYLQAQYYIRATTGSGVEALPGPIGGPTVLTGTGTQGAVAGGAQVPFSDPLVAQYARELAADQLAHLGFLRSAIGAAAVAQPAIDISNTATSPFTKLAQAGGVAAAPGTFDPYISDANFLLGAFVIQDVVVSALKTIVPLLINTLFIDRVAGIFSIDSYNASLIRTQLYAKGVATQTSAGQFSDARDALDGSSDDDQGVGNASAGSNITPADGNGIVFGRTLGQVMNVLYVNHAAVVGGGFFPNGINSTYFAKSDAN